MTRSEELDHVEQQILATRRLLWNASQMRRAAGVFRLSNELDRLVDRKYELLRSAS